MKHKRNWWIRPLPLIIVLSLLWAFLLAVDWLPGLRGGYGWRWPYAILADWRRLLPLLGGLILYLLVADWLRRGERAGWLLVWAMAGTVGLTLAALFVTNDPFFELYTVVVSGDTGGWHYAAARIDDIGAALRHWPQFMRDSEWFSSHMSISPPGMVLVYFEANQVLAQWTALSDRLAPILRAAQCHNYRINDYSNAQLASSWLGMLMPLWSSLTVWPLYMLGKVLYGRPAALWAVFWWPLIPGLLMMSPSPNTAFPFWATAVITLLLWGLWHNRPVWVLAAGALLSLLTFMTMAFLPLVLLAGVFTLGLYLSRHRLTDAPTLSAVRWHWPVVMGIWFGFGLLLVWAVYYLVYGVTFIQIFQSATLTHFELERPYLPWLFLHSYDYFIFTGWPLVLLAGWGIWLVWRRWRQAQMQTVGELFVLAVFLSFALLIVSGTLRGETGRILLYYTPFLLLIAAQGLVQHRGKTIARDGRLLTVTQVVLLLVMVAFLRVGGAEFNVLPPAAAPPLAQPPPEPIVTTAVAMGDALQLQAFSGQVVNTAEGDLLQLWLYWHSIGQVDQPYWLSFIPVNGSQAAPQATLLQPFEEQYPTTCWRPGESFGQQVNVPLFTAVSDDDWWVSFSLVSGRTGQKMTIVTADGLIDDQVGLGPFSQP